MADVEMIPKETFVHQDNTHRLIAQKNLDKGASVLSRIADTSDQLNNVFELDSATNPRLIAESTGLPGISKELVFGVPYAHIINGCFAHPSPVGGRFNTSDRGAWYAAFELETSQREVAYHRLKLMQETSWNKKSSATYVDFLADFRNNFHDLREETNSSAFLHPTDYTNSQALATMLLMQRSMGLIYPSVRHEGGTCLACFRPVLVSNVRKAGVTTFTYDPELSRISIQC